MLSEVAWMVLASLALPLVEASFILISNLSLVETEAYAPPAGYSWKSNEYGLTVDSVTQFNLVSPNGTEVEVTEANEDLWFALKVCLTMVTDAGSMLTYTTGRIQ